MGIAAMLVMWSGRFEQIYVPSAPGNSSRKFATIGPVAFEVLCENKIAWESWVNGMRMWHYESRRSKVKQKTLIFCIRKYSSTS